MPLVESITPAEHTQSPPRKALSLEASGAWWRAAVFKTDVAGSPGQAGSIPVRLRQTSTTGAIDD